MNDIDSYIKNNTLKIIVKPNSPKTEIIKWDNEKQALRIAVKAPPEKGKANTAIIKFFSKLLKKKVLIVSGKANKEKLLRIQ